MTFSSIIFQPSVEDLFIHMHRLAFEFLSGSSQFFKLHKETKEKKSIYIFRSFHEEKFFCVIHCIRLLLILCHQLDADKEN